MDYLLILIVDVSIGGGAHSRVNNRLFLRDQRSLLQSTGLVAFLMVQWRAAPQQRNPLRKKVFATSAAALQLQKPGMRFEIQST